MVMYILSVNVLQLWYQIELTGGCNRLGKEGVFERDSLSQLATENNHTKCNHSVPLINSVDTSIEPNISNCVVREREREREKENSRRALFGEYWKTAKL